MCAARELTVALRGRWRGRYGTARCPAHADRNPSLSISDGHDGKFLLKCFAGCSFTDILAALRGQGLLEVDVDHQYRRPDPKVDHQRRNAKIRDRRRRVETAQRAWRRAQPTQLGDPVDTYLTSRGLAGPWPATLRTLLRPWQWRSVKVPVAMVAAATRWPARQVMAVQVTALTMDGRKAEVEPARKTFGILTSAAVRLGEWREGMPIALAEGVEDGLSIRQAMPNATTTPWACIGAWNAKGVTFPSAAEVLLVLDGDPEGVKAAQKAADALTVRGHRVRVAELPDGTDPNEVFAS